MIFWRKHLGLHIPLICKNNVKFYTPQASLNLEGRDLDG